MTKEEFELFKTIFTEDTSDEFIIENYKGMQDSINRLGLNITPSYAIKILTDKLLQEKLK